MQRVFVHVQMQLLLEVTLVAVESLRCASNLRVFLENFLHEMLGLALALHKCQDVIDGVRDDIPSLCEGIEFSFSFR